MKVHDVLALARERHQAPEPWLEFLRAPALSVGIYRLRAGATDRQEPHAEDEVYYVLEGRGVLRVAGEDVPVFPGALAYVAAKAEHRFHSIAEELVLLVFFAPAEGSTGADPID
jgi:mannose-6-phosphate isomerase-like protein (cupin superfamily)